MTVKPEIDAHQAELVAIFEDLHAHPELGFEESRTAAVVAESCARVGWMRCMKASAAPASLA